MSLQFNSQYVDEKYRAGIEPNLFNNTFLVDGVTYDSSWQEGNAGGIFVHKMGKSTIAVKNPGSDFTNSAVADSLLAIAMVNLFQFARKRYQVTINSITADVAEGELAEGIAEIREGRELSAAACLKYEGTTSATTTALTTTNFKSLFLAERQAIVAGLGNPDTCILSPAAYAILLEVASGKDFTPISNDKVNTEGRCGIYLGIKCFEYQGIGAASAIEYYDYSNTKRTIASATNAAIDFIMYDHRALAVVDNITSYRIVDGAPVWNGVAAQGECCTGFRVKNATSVSIKTH